MFRLRPQLDQVPAPEKYAAISAVVISLVLSAVKFWAYFLTDSAAVFSDAIESIVNVAASVFALYALALAHEPADEEHPYGHGKVEFLSATFEGGMIFAAAIAVLWNSIGQWLTGSDIARPAEGAALIGFTALVNGIAGFVLVRIGRRRGSLALEADGRHLVSDVVTSLGVLLSLALVYLTGQAWIDIACALLVVLYLFRTSYSLLRRSTAGLMDEQDAEDDLLLKDLLDKHVSGELTPRICSYHKLRHRHTGRYHWVDFHISVPENMSVGDSHAVASQIEGEMERALGEGDATAHIEPCEGCDRCGDAESHRAPRS